MAKIENLFPTQIYQGTLPDKAALNRAMKKDIDAFYRQDKLGRNWSKENYRHGYTSYASLVDLQYRSPSFAKFADLLQPHVEKYAKALGWHLRGWTLHMNACWMNIMPAGAYHTMHVHPHSVVSGTYYVNSPPGCSSLKLEDPRMPLYMNAPDRNGGKKNALFYEVNPSAGGFVLFESWLRHEVPPNRSKEPRISISFNYGIEEVEYP